MQQMTLWLITGPTGDQAAMQHMFSVFFTAGHKITVTWLPSLGCWCVLYSGNWDCSCNVLLIDNPPLRDFSPKQTDCAAVNLAGAPPTEWFLYNKWNISPLSAHAIAQLNYKKVWNIDLGDIVTVVTDNKTVNMLWMAIRTIINTSSILYIFCQSDV